MLNKLYSDIPRIMSVIFKRSWKSDIPNDYRKANVALILKIVLNINLRTCSMVSITGVPRKISVNPDYMDFYQKK